MKRKNFPGRKMQRQLLAQRENRYNPWSLGELEKIEKAKASRTKKNRAG